MIGPKISFQIVGTPPMPPLGPAALLKFVEPNPAYCRSVREIVGPGCLFIGRWYTDEQPLDDDPDGRADEWFWQHKDAMLQLRDTSGPWAFEGYNEIAGGDAPDYPQARAYCTFEMERVRMMDWYGLRAVALNCSVGTPDIDEWAAYDPLLDLLRERKLGHLVGLHEYWTNRSDMENRYHLFRFWLAGVARHLRGLQIVATEGGREHIPDRGLPEDQWGRPGWQLSCGADEFYGDLEYLSQLAETDSQYVGMTLYQYGSLDPRFAPYDVGPILERMAADHRGGQPTTPVTDEPLPQNEPIANWEKAAWWTEEAVRQLEALGVDRTCRAMRIMYGLIEPENGLLIRLREGR